MQEITTISPSTAITNEIEHKIKKQVLRHKQISWLPTEAARTSIFSPISDRNLRGHSTDLVVKTSWGRVEVSGPALNITDEDIFLALLHEVRRLKSITIKINYTNLCRAMGKTPHSKTNARIKRGIRRLAATNVYLETNCKQKYWSIERLISKAAGCRDYTAITVDGWFYDKFLENEIVLIDLRFRKNLKGDVAKALYRFLCTHRGCGRYAVATLVNALNMDSNQAEKKKRQTLKRAFNQLQQKKFLTFKFNPKSGVFFDIKKIKKYKPPKYVPTGNGRKYEVVTHIPKIKR